jgi:hypothetical protein
MKLNRSGAVVAALLAALMGSAAAHSPYLLPNAFAVSKDHVTVQGSMTEDDYFVPEFAIRAGDYLLVDPSGAEAKIATVTQHKDVVVVEAPTPKDGTYRISTGERVGRTMKVALIDGQWRTVRPANAPRPQAAAARPPMQGGAPPVSNPRVVEEAAVPAGAEMTEVQTVLKAETYVTKGAPSPGALAVSGKGFEIKPATHPNEIYLDTGFTFAALVDGAPTAGLRFTVYRGGNAYEEKKVFAEARTDAKGELTLSFDRPGVYVMLTRYPARAAEGAKPAPRTYVYSMTFEVMQ